MVRNLLSQSLFCRSTNPAYYYGAAFGAGVGPIYFDNVRCNGKEKSLLDCNFTSLHDCVHGEDVSVFCTGKHLMPRYKFMRIS